MIRSTVNATIKSTYRAGMLGESIELCYGDASGTDGDATHEMTEVEWLINKGIEIGATISPVPSNTHFDGS